ncbi:hypothetical protein [Aquiflexum sp.]|uniref:hypothetical protein n=1 Tax=Aquiflexum sp. TaxID=1872584 RepID=UPI0035935A94
MRDRLKKSNICLLLISLHLLSCSDERPDIIQTKSGLFGSTEGRFLAKFPREPSVSVQKTIWGTETIETVTFNTSFGDEHHYIVSYSDLPQAILDSWEVEAMFDQTVKTLAATFGNFSVNERSVEQLQGFQKCLSYKLFPVSRDTNSMVSIRLAKKGSRIYTVAFAALRRIPETSKINEFMESFKLYEPKEAAK